MFRVKIKIYIFCHAISAIQLIRAIIRKHSSHIYFINLTIHLFFSKYLSRLLYVLLISDFVKHPNVNYPRNIHRWNAIINCDRRRACNIISHQIHVFSRINIISFPIRSIY